jgi:chromosome partitioning protein
MIITILNQVGISSSAGLASHLAMRRAQAGRNVLLIYPNSLAPSHGAKNLWQAVEIKLGAVAHTVIDKNLDSKLRNLASRYNDIVIDAGTHDLAGNRPALMATNMAIVPIQSGHFGVKVQHRLTKRIEAARVGNPALRVLLLILGAAEDISIGDIETARTFVATIRSTVLVNMPLCDRTAVQERPWDNARKPLNGARENAAMSRLYRSVFLND